MRDFTRELAAARPKRFAALIACVVLLAVGLSFSMKTDTEWRVELAGKKLTRASNSGAISDQINIYFCPNGDYAMRRQFSGFSAIGVGDLAIADEDVEFGRWAVTAGTLVLKAESGDRQEFGIAEGVDSNVLELNGIGYLISPHDECIP